VESSAIDGIMRHVDATELRGWCLEQPGATEDFPFGPEHSAFNVTGKMFALSALDRTALEVRVKCEPDLALQLRASYPAIRPGYHLNKRHRNTITLDGVFPDHLVRDLIEHSYDHRHQRSARARPPAARLDARDRSGTFGRAQLRTLRLSQHDVPREVVP
jgi:predicted DNA-binding protein (MmcQ/YjbR family)